MSIDKYLKITIITPVYNQVKYIEQTILSVLNQGYPNLEYIIIDGGSTDGTVDIIKKYESQLAYWISEPDNGMYDALQKGFERSTGEIMGWLNADDMYHPNSFFTVAQIFSDYPRISWLVGAQAHYDELGRIVHVGNSPYFNHLDFLQHKYQWIQQESTFWRRSLYEKAGGIHTKYKLAGDFDLWMRFSRHKKMYVTTALIGGFRHRDLQLSKNIELYYREADDIIAMEAVSDEEKKQVKQLKRKCQFVSWTKKLKILNWHSINSRLMHRYTKEEASQRVFFDFDQKRFVVPE